MTNLEEMEELVDLDVVQCSFIDEELTINYDIVCDLNFNEDEELDDCDGYFEEVFDGCDCH